MSAAIPSLRAPTLALCLLACACPTETSGTAAAGSKAKAGQGPAAKDKDKGKTGADKGGAKGGLGQIAKQGVDAQKAADAGTEAEAEAKVVESTQPPGPGKYRRGQMPPPTLATPEMIKEYALDMGDPTGGEFTLEQAFEGAPELADKSKGKLTATFDTTMGSFDCELYEDDTPLTVANFVGLARGTRPTYDKERDAWVAKRYYDGVIFHRVIKGFMSQTGDASGSGRGNPGFVIPDEFVDKLEHDAAGVLSMANRSKPNTGSSQFFITARDTHHLDGKHTVFGKCEPKVPVAISEVKVDHRSGDRPYERVTINRIEISRK